MTTPESPEGQGPTRTGRRRFLTGALTVAALALGGGALVVSRDDPPVAPAEATPPPEDTVPVHGDHQAGIDRPARPQSFGMVTVLDLADDDLDFLPALGELVAALVAGVHPELLPDGPVGLTVTVGIGPRLVAARRPGSAGSQDLPAFDRDTALDPAALGGDLMLAVYAHDPTVLKPMTTRLRSLVPGHAVRWAQRCFRGPGEGTVVRSPLGFHDGIEVPRTPEAFDEGVWCPDPAGATICVVRRLRLDHDAFEALSPQARERVIGRRMDGSPLSGGAPFAEADVHAKTPAGDFLIPEGSHLRSAHPSFTGSPLMLRRSYTYDEGDDDRGLLFVCFQRELRTFVATQQRLDEVDALGDFVTTTASGTFLVLPGFTPDRPLGSALLD